LNFEVLPTGNLYAVGLLNVLKFSHSKIDFPPPPKVDPPLEEKEDSPLTEKFN